MAKKKVLPQPIEQSSEVREEVMKMHMKSGGFEPDTYKFDDKFKDGNPKDFSSVHTIPEMIACLEANDKIEAEGIFIESNTHGHSRYTKIKSRDKILETVKKNSRIKKMREVNFDTVGGGYVGTAGANAGLVGDDYVPLLGGPFNKQAYLYDYLRAASYCYYEWNHHPFAKAIINTTRDFVLGNGFRVDCEDDKALTMWKAFAEVNHLDELAEDIVKEGSIYGETMIWWLPNMETYISYNDAPGQEPARGIIPRIRLLDPTTCWEIVTMPEDIRRALFYWFVFPTQYQIKTGTLAGSTVPTAKFINQQIAASDIMHFKYNCVSNEKRGRSDLFPILGYLKWVRDVVNYKLIAVKKQAAWTEDIVVQGSQTDVDNLSQSLQQLGAFEPAGSRFIHTDKITREYLESKAGGTGKDDALEWGLNMCAAGVQIPVSYFGLSHSSGQTRASAMVGTEPVTKKFERRQNEVRRIFKAIWRRFQDNYGIKGSECEITFPEIITQDRSAKLKDIKFSEDCGYISRDTAAPLAAKELGLDDKYSYDQELQKIQKEQNPPILPNLGAPLTAPPQAPVGASSTPPNSSGASADKPQPSAVTKTDRHALSMGKGA